jgi:hypothetical protein
MDELRESVDTAHSLDLIEWLAGFVEGIEHEHAAREVYDILYRRSQSGSHRLQDRAFHPCGRAAGGRLVVLLVPRW